MSKTKHATLCVLGRPARSCADNDARLDLIYEAVNDLKSTLAQTFIMPGGMIWSDQALFRLSPLERRKAVQNLDVIQSIVTLIPKHMTLITGLDVAAPDQQEPHAQYSVALQQNKVTAVSRKIFPTKGEIKQGAFIQAQDFADSSRFVTTASGREVLLHTCYDLFGSVDAASGKHSASRLSHVPSPENSKNKSSCYLSYKDMLNRQTSSQAPVITVNIHDFEKPSRDIFYQRHGIASASAAFDNALVLGAAHFETALPLLSTSSTLSAHGVPKSHLSARFHRKAHHLQAISVNEINASSQNVRGALRVFEC
jgi:predicted amidohydrolase